MKDSFQEMLYREQMKINMLLILINSIEMCINKGYLHNEDKDTLLSIANKLKKQNQVNQEKVNVL
jgi:hypothetical protein